MKGVWIQIKRLFLQLKTQGLWLTSLAGLDKLARVITGRPMWRFAWITPEILLGGQPARNLWKQLTGRGVTGVINMRDEYDYREEIGHMPVRYLHLPTVDNTAPTLEHLRLGTAFIERELSGGGKVYIHCWEGLGRGPSMVAAHFVSQGKTADEAWKIIRTIRPFIRPTQEQIDRLEEFATLQHEPEATTTTQTTVDTQANTAQQVNADPTPSKNP